MNEHPRPRLLLVGAFPPPDTRIFGGIISACAALLASSMPSRVAMDLIDSTQISNPPPRAPVRLALAVRRVGAYLRRLLFRRPDVVMLFASSGASLVEKGAMAWAARLVGVPAMLFPRSGAIIDEYDTSRLSRAATRFAFGGAPMILCQGERWHAFATQRLNYPPRMAPVIPNWTATPQLLAIGAARAAPAGTAGTLLYVGWLETKKGVLELLEAFATLGDRPGLLLEILGDGHARPQAEALAQRLGIAARTVFHGWKTADERDRMLARADIFVLPSHSEGLPNAMIEAMSARLPVVVTDVGNVSSFITDGENGLLIQPRDAGAIRLAIARLLDDPALRGRLADAAFDTASAVFSVEPAVDRLVQAIETVTKHG